MEVVRKIFMPSVFTALGHLDATRANKKSTKDKVKTEKSQRAFLNELEIKKRAVEIEQRLFSLANSANETYDNAFIMKDIIGDKKLAEAGERERYLINKYKAEAEEQRRELKE
jgi:hypothetical protein